MVLSMRARALLSLILGITVLLGSWTAVGFSLLAIFGDAFSGNGSFAALVTSVVPLAAAASAVLLAPAPDHVDETWDAVAMVARVLGIVAVIVVVVALIAGLVNESPFGYGGIY